MITSVAPKPLPGMAPSSARQHAPFGGADPSTAVGNDADVALIRELQRRDREVRIHERAHAAAAGNLANGGARLQFTRGPDGRQYATGGEVSIDVAPVPDDPRATLRKAEKIRRAALAPTNPSAQDRAVAARAAAMATEARIELQRSGAEHDPDGKLSSAVCKECGEQHGATAVSAADPYRQIGADEAARPGAALRAVA